MNLRIRTATDLDREPVRNVHLHAFAEGENRVVAALAVDMLAEDTNPDTFSLVAESANGVIGHIAFSPVFAETTGDYLGYILAPLAVLPAHHNSGVGSMLIESGLKRLSENAADVVLVYGDPGYYGRFGFSAETATRFLPPYELQYPLGWQAIVLRDDRLDGRPVRLSCVASLRDPGLW